MAWEIGHWPYGRSQPPALLENGLCPLPPTPGSLSQPKAQRPWLGQVQKERVPDTDTQYWHPVTVQFPDSPLLFPHHRAATGACKPWGGMGPTGWGEGQRGGLWEVGQLELGVLAVEAH